MKKNAVEQEKQREDLGFGSKATSTSARLMKANGDFNVKKIGQSFEARLNLYNRLIMMHWGKFIFVVFFYYVIINLLFGLLYFWIGVENLQGISTENALSDFSEAFFFSSQTLTTVGYGRISPIGLLTNTVAAFEALMGLMTFAIMTGVLYGRFSKPSPKIIFSKKAIVAPYLDTQALMFRIVNEKSNQLTNVEASMILSQNEIVNGEIKRKYYGLDLERTKVKFFAMAWTVVHPITKDSILYNKTKEDLKDADVELLISIEAIDDTVTDTVHLRKSYLYTEIEFNVSFDQMLEVNDHEYLIDLNKVGKYS